MKKIIFSFAESLTETLFTEGGLSLLFVFPIVVVYFVQSAMQPF